MLPTGFEPTIPRSSRLQTHALRQRVFLYTGVRCIMFRSTMDCMYDGGPIRL